MAGDSGLLPEQIWDSADIPDQGLFMGHPSGSAMPLVWAHAEYVKLCRSLRDQEVFDRPPQTVRRYLTGQATAARIARRINNKIRSMQAGRNLRVELLAPAVVHWSIDGWRTVHDTPTRDTTLGVYFADLETTDLRVDDGVEMTFYWPSADRWEGVDFVICVE
jgi:glucoamylase